MRIFLKFLSLLIIILVSGSCHKPDSTTGPCSNAVRIKPDFTMQENVYRDRYFNSNTFWEYENIIFTSAVDYDEYYWTIGNSGKIWKTKSFTLSFDQPYDSLQVRLIGKRKPEPCFPNEPSIDTITKTLRISNYSSPLLGRWKMTDQNDSKNSITVNIKSVDSPATTGLYYGYMYNMMPPNCVSAGRIDYMGNKSFYLENDHPGCYDLQAWGYLDDNDTNKMTLEYTYYPTLDPGKPTKKTFRGIRD